MIHHTSLTDAVLRSKIRKLEITLGGNKKLRIYGTLACTSGKRMKKENRVFFSSKTEACKLLYRPCGHCMQAEYQKWKNGSF
ncbi:MAG: Ada metal-binding domain-containing protein [Agriterribacter sp.]